MPAIDKKEIGKIGERIAQNYLVSKGYKVLATNWVYGRSEIDIVAQFSQFIVFVEVKTRTSSRFGLPETAVDANKIRQIEKASEAYIFENQYQGEVRFDIIAIILNGVDIQEITHFEDAFFPMN